MLSICSLLKKEIPYHKIRAIEKERGIYCNSIMSLKNALDHINIKYNKFDITTVSVVDNDDLIRKIEARRADGDTHTASTE